MPRMWSADAVDEDRFAVRGKRSFDCRDQESAHTSLRELYRIRVGDPVIGTVEQTLCTVEDNAELSVVKYAT